MQGSTEGKKVRRVGIKNIGEIEIFKKKKKYSVRVTMGIDGELKWYGTMELNGDALLRIC